MSNLATNLDRPEHPSGRLCVTARVRWQYREGVNAHAASHLQFIAHVQESQADAGWIPRVVRCTAVAEVVAVVGLLL